MLVDLYRRWPGMLTQLGLQPPAPMIRLAARRSAWQHRRAQRRLAGHAAG